MPALRDVQLFISHSWKYGEHYEKMIEFLYNRIYFNFTDHSIPKDDPIHNAKNDSELYKAIKEKMDKAQVVIIPAGVYASYSKWIDKEIEYAYSIGIPILAVRPRGQENLSNVVTTKANKLVGWNRESIIGGIRELIK